MKKMMMLTMYLVRVRMRSVYISPRVILFHSRFMIRMSHTLIFVCCLSVFPVSISLLFDIIYHDLLANSKRSKLFRWRHQFYCFDRQSNYVNNANIIFICTQPCIHLDEKALTLKQARKQNKWIKYIYLCDLRVRSVMLLTKVDSRSSFIFKYVLPA
jgi:hypothetical protein